MLRKRARFPHSGPPKKPLLRITCLFVYDLCYAKIQLKLPEWLGLAQHLQFFLGFEVL